MKDTTAVRIATGIYQDACGFQARVQVGRLKDSKRFDPETPVKFMQSWQTQRRAELDVEQVAAVLPTENWRGLTPSLDGWCYVYFVRAGACVKIGRAVDVRQRFRGLQTAHEGKLSLVLSIPAHADLEGAIHARFAHLRERGEWFRLEPDLIAYIQAVQQGANPIALLWETQ